MAPTSQTLQLRCGGIKNHIPTGWRIKTPEVSCQGPHWHPRQWHLQLPNRWKPSILSESLSSVQLVLGALPVLLPGCFFQFSFWQQLMNSSSIASLQKAPQEFCIHPGMRTMAQLLRSISLSFPGLPPTVHPFNLPGKGAFRSPEVQLAKVDMEKCHGACTHEL